MAKINPKALKNVFTEEVLDVLPTNNKIKHGIGIAKRNEDPAYKEAIKKRTESKEWQDANTAKGKTLAQTESWKANHAAGQKRMKNDPVWQAEQQERLKRRNQNPVWLERIKESRIAMAQDENWIANNKNAIRARCAKPIITPVGVFAAAADAAREYNKIRNFNNGKTWIANQLKKNPTEFYYISKEEYIMLTGKEI